MMTRRNDETRIGRPASPFAKRRRSVWAPQCEALEGRALLSGLPDVGLVGTVATPGGVSKVVVPLTADRFAPGRSGATVFQLEVEPTNGSQLAVRVPKITGPAGKTVPVAWTQSGQTWTAVVSLRPGKFTVTVHGRPQSSGDFEVTANLAGDVGNSNQVNQADVAAVRADLGAHRPSARYDPALDIDGNGRINHRDVALVRRNLGANNTQMLFNIANSTNGQYTNAQLYVAIIGLDSAGQWSHLTANGTFEPMKGSDNGELVDPKTGIGYSNYFIPLSDLPNGINIPAGFNIASGRVWIGAGAPLFLHLNTDGAGKVVGYTQPDVNNPSDPNIPLYWDFVEFTYAGGSMGADTTQVDEFGIPMTITLDSNGPQPPVQTTGITVPRSTIFSQYMSTVPQPFQINATTQTPYRILAPKHIPSLATSNYFDQYISDVWTYYATNALHFTNLFGSFTGHVVNNVLVFTDDANPGQQYSINRPTNQDVMSSNGVFVDTHGLSGRPLDIQLKLQAQLDAGFNRHVLATPGVDPNSSNPSQFYLTAPANFYARFWHQVSLNGLAYGFDYDDVGNQSSFITGDKATQLLVTVRWN